MEDQVENAPVQMTFGEKLVELNFNPSNDGKVSKAKRLCADLADLVKDEADRTVHSKLNELLFNKAIGDILDAQMNAVKVLTFEY